MKKISTILIAAVALMAITAACSKDIDSRLPYFATWTWSDGWTLTISANEIRVDNTTGGWYKVSPITWTAVTNTNSETKNNYPSGYKITGLISAENDSHWGDVGEPFGDTWTHFIHKDGKSMIEQEDGSDGWHNVLIKQGL